MSSVHVGSSEQLNVYLQPTQGDLVLRQPDEGSTISGATARLLGRLWLRAMAAALIVMVLSALAAVLAVSLVPIAVGTVVATVASCATFLISNVIEPFGEWRSFLQDRASADLSVYSAIYGDLRRARVPATVVARRVATGAVPNTAANRLEITDGIFTIDVAVFGYGTGLYIGWAMFRRRPGAAVLRASLANLARSLRQRPDTVRIATEAERPRVLREAVHASCLAGLKTAVEKIDVPIGFGFPDGLPAVADLPSWARTRSTVAAPLWVPPRRATEPVGSVERPTAAVSIYLADARGAEQLETAVDRFLAEHGFDIVAKSEPVTNG